MRVQRVKVLMSFVIFGLIVGFLIRIWAPSVPTVMDGQRRLNSTIKKLLDRNEQLRNSKTTVLYYLKETTAQ